MPRDILVDEYKNQISLSWSSVNGAKSYIIYRNDVKVGESILGRVVDAFGNPIDDQLELSLDERWPINGKPTNPMKKSPIREKLDVGIKVINSLFTVGRGQRLGIIAGSGVGKSILLGMMTKFTEADIVVVGLIGERGR